MKFATFASEENLREAIGKDLFPHFQGTSDLIGFAGGGELPYDRTTRREKWQQRFVVQCAREWCAMIACGPLDIMDVGTDDVILNFS